MDWASAPGTTTAVAENAATPAHSLPINDRLASGDSVSGRFIVPSLFGVPGAPLRARRFRFRPTPCLVCEHNGGIIYIVPSESSWVCREENIGAHAITGFFEDLTNIESTQVTALMQKWGLYYRTLDVIA